MRFSRAQFQQFARGKSGAILEPGDGELVLPALLQPVIEPAGPLETSNIIGGLKGNSFIDDLAINQPGANPGQVTNTTLTMDAGLWHLRGHFLHRFTGGLSAQYAYLNLAIPGGTAAWLIEVPYALSAANYGVVPWEHLIHVTVPGTLIQIVTGATVAGDILRVSVGYIANKLL